MSETPMTEARIEELVAEMDRQDYHIRLQDLRALLADWRAKKAEIERLRDNLRECETVGQMDSWKQGNDEGAEAMRAKCEAVARGEAKRIRGMFGSGTALDIADAIASLKQS